MTEREELENAIAALDQQRPVLGEAALEAALAGLRQKLSALEGGEPVSREQLITRFMRKPLAEKMQAARHVESERMGMRYDEGMAHLEVGLCLGESAHLEKAESVLANIGAELQLARARK